MRDTSVGDKRTRTHRLLERARCLYDADSAK
jgi:hypothetical protein